MHHCRIQRNHSLRGIWREPRRRTQDGSRENRNLQHNVSNMPKRGSSRPVSDRMATGHSDDGKPRDKVSDTVKTWQRVNHAREFIVGQQVFLDFLR